MIFTFFYLSSKRLLTISRRRPLSYRNQSINLLRKSIDWFLYDNGLRLERVKKHREKKLYQSGTLFISRSLLQMNDVFFKIIKNGIFDIHMPLSSIRSPFEFKQHQSKKTGKFSKRTCVT